MKCPWNRSSWNKCLTPWMLTARQHKKHSINCFPYCHIIKESTLLVLQGTASSHSTNLSKDSVKHNIARDDERQRNSLVEIELCSFEGIYMETDQAETENETPEQGASNLQEDVEEDDEHFMTLLDKLGGDRVFEE